MKHQTTLTVTSLVSILLFSLHWTDEIARGLESGSLSSAGGILILVVWLYATVALIPRPLGVIVVLLGSIMGAGVPILHMQGAGLIKPRIAETGHLLFWVWTNIALGAISAVSVLLCIHLLWNRRRNRPAV